MVSILSQTDFEKESKIENSRDTNSVLCVFRKDCVGSFPRQRFGLDDSLRMRSAVAKEFFGRFSAEAKRLLSGFMHSS